MSGITTHVLDTTTGRPAAGVAVRLERLGRHQEWEPVGRGSTDADGRLATLLGDAAAAPPGVYRLIFDSAAYFAASGTVAFHPHVTVEFEVVDRNAHHHVPLLVSPYSYTTYRGS